MITLNRATTFNRATTRSYNRNGLVSTSFRGTAVLKMCREFASVLKVNDGEPYHGAMTEAYRNWSAKQSKTPLTYVWFMQIVNTFYPLYEKGETLVFKLLNDTDMSYDFAIAFARDMMKLERYGLKVVKK